jgi:hypothetical protein
LSVQGIFFPFQLHWNSCCPAFIPCTGPETHRV